MNGKNFGLVKQNTCYEIQYQRKNPTFSPYSPGYKRIRPLSNASRESRERVANAGSRILSVGRGEVTIKVEEESNCKTDTEGNNQIKIVSISADNIHENNQIINEQESKTVIGARNSNSQTKSLVPVLHSKAISKAEDVLSKQFSVVSKSLDLRGSPESMRQLRNYIKSITNTQLSTFKDELTKISEQNKCLREELNIHSETISKLLDITTDKNNIIADIKSRNARLEKEIRIKNDINENFVALMKEVDDLKTKYLLNDEEKLKSFIKDYLKSKKDNHRTKKCSSETSTGLSGVTSFSHMSDCSDLLSEIHTHMSQVSFNVPEPILKALLSSSQNQSQVEVESLQKFADSMEVLSKKSRRISFRKIFCCKPV